MDREVKGFTLIELLVAVAILAILLSIGLAAFLDWRKKVLVEQDVDTIFRFIQSKRMEAFSKKQSITVTVSGSQICANPGGCVDLNFPARANVTSFTINARGFIVPGGTISVNTDADAKYDCVVVSTVRVKKGKRRGGSCEPI